METRRNSGNNESANLELVLEQFANEQKYQTKSLNELVVTINSLTEQVTKLEKEKLDSKPVSFSRDIMPIQELIRKGVNDIKLIVSTERQKPILKKYQLLLFPEQDARLFYKIVFGRWFLWLAVMLLITNLYKYGLQYSNSKKEIELQILENDRIKKAWDRLYFNGNRGVKKLMDSAYSTTEF